MENTNAAPVYFVDGCVIDRRYIYLAAKLKSLDPEEVDYSRMFFLYHDKWFYHDLKWDVVSVCFTSKTDSEPRKFYALSMQGDVEIQYLGGADIDKIPDAGTYQGLGAVKQIREIGEYLYVCGDQGQVYKKASSGAWDHIDDGLLDRTISASALDLNSIDGTSDNDLYVVGFNGKIFHRDGLTWREVDSPTNMHLERVRCVSTDEVYICGNKGVFLKGDKNGFKDLTMPGLEDNFWGLEHYKGNVYLATLNGLYIYNGKDLEPLRTGLEPEIKGYRLDARDDVLWSFGVDDLAYFDGIKWVRVVHPDNL